MASRSCFRDGTLPLILTLCAFGTLAALSGCKREFAAPEITAAENSEPGAVNHADFDRTCVTCHQKKRPAPPHEAEKDCVVCHRAGTFWLDLKFFGHNPVPTACVRCHEKDRPTPAILSGFSKHGYGVDCVSCHVAGTQWTDNKTFSHVPAPSTCITCHETKRPKTVALPPPAAPLNSHFADQDCAACHRPRATEGQPFIFEHKAFDGRVLGTCLPCHEARRKSPDHNPGKDCSGCHIDPAKSWKLSVLSPHPANDPMPQNCAYCHVGWRPNPDTGHFGDQDCIFCHKPASNEVKVFEFSHFARGTVVATCSGCHETKRPAELVNNHFLHSVGGAGDCAPCHASGAGSSWSTADFSHSPAPESCAPCHAGQRPTTLVQRFLHSAAGTGDCASCHLRPGMTWSGGIYLHNPRPAACATCHEAERPSQLVNRFLHSVVGARDCVSCHANPGVSWTGATYAHAPAPATCEACHDSNRPTTVVSNFNHSLSGTGDCVNCHKQPGVTWAGGTYAHSPKPAECQSCHANKRPAGMINRFDHALAGKGDCAPCHLNPGVSWSGGRYAHAPVPANCSICHEAQRPMGNVGTRNFSHTDSACGGYDCHGSYHSEPDCGYCHYSPGVKWQVPDTSVIDKNTCGYCHTQGAI